MNDRENQQRSLSNLRPRRLGLLAATFLCAAFAPWLANVAWGHGDAAPQPVETGNLPKLGEDWLASNPFREGKDHDEAIEVGSRGYNSNCARCHGLEAVSGGMAPDLRKLDADCAGDASCLNDIDAYYLDTIRHGRTRDGRVYMPPFEGIFNQEAMWAIRTYIESRPPYQ